MLDRLALVMLVCLLSAAGAAWGQIIYEPVGAYGSSLDPQLYYSARDPVYRPAFAPPLLPARRIFDFRLNAFSNGDPPFGGQGFTDTYDWIEHPYWPGVNAAWWGLTRDEVTQATLSQLPLYFRKADLLGDAEYVGGGAVAVPAIPRPLFVPPPPPPPPMVLVSHGGVRPTTRPSPGEIVIRPGHKSERPPENVVIISRKAGKRD
jgi:hypothetical protein